MSVLFVAAKRQKLPLTKTAYEMQTNMAKRMKCNKFSNIFCVCARPKKKERVVSLYSIHSLKSCIQFVRSFETLHTVQLYTDLTDYYIEFLYKLLRVLKIR